jgi:cholesterol transport system auxiliary component
MTHRTARPIAALTLLLAASGCGDLLKQPYPPKALFGLEPGTPDVSAVPAAPSPTAPGYINRNAYVVATSRPAGTGSVMLVRPVRVSPPYDGQAFTYRDGPSGYTSDYYSNWVAAPSALLSGSLTDWLDRAGPVPVVAPGSSLRPDLVLDGEVTKLLVDRTDRARPKAVLVARFFLVRETGSSTTVLSDTSYSAAVPVTSDTPAGYADAWGRAWRQVLQRLTEDVRSAVARPPA